MKIVLYRDRRRDWRWRIVARNGRVVADSAEGYRRPGQCTSAVKRLQLGLGKAKIIIKN